MSRYGGYRGHRGGNGADDAGLGCLLMIAAFLFALPIVGIYMIAKAKSKQDVAAGVIVLIIGIAVWICCASQH